MTTKRILSVVLLLVLLLCSLFGCKKGFTYPEELTGAWYGRADYKSGPFAGATVLTFTPDGVVTVEKPSGTAQYTVVGTDSTLTVRTLDGKDAWGVSYKVDGGRLIIYFDDEFIKVG